MLVTHTKELGDFKVHFMALNGD